LGREIFEFTVGSREVMPGVSKAVVGMIEGERKHLTLSPADAYGEFRSQLIREIPRTRFPSAYVLRVGKQITMIGAKSRRRRKATIVTVKPTSVVIDGNHPLAGKTLDVEIQ
jgi:peptidylprolyl isomerase